MALAGKYGQLLNAAANNPRGAVAKAAIGAGLLGGIGSLVGNLTDKEQGEGPLRMISESVNAGTLAAVPGAIAGLSAATLGAARNPSVLRAAVKKAGSAQPIRNAVQRVATTGALSLGAIPVAAGLGGMLGGGGSNLYEAMGVPGFQAGTDPEAYGSSNSPGAIYKTPTTQYM